jgi:hypothetical protein
VYFEDQARAWHPAKKGVSINFNSIDAIIEGLTKAKAALQQRDMNQLREEIARLEE